MVKIQESGLSFKSYRLLKEVAASILEKLTIRENHIESVSEIINEETYQGYYRYQSVKSLGLEKVGEIPEK